MQRAAILLWLLPLVPSGLCAQGTTWVSPHYLRDVEGPGSTTHPLGIPPSFSPAMRYLAVHDDLLGHAGVLRELRLRQGADPYNGASATLVQAELRVSTANTTAATVSAVFDTNHGADRTTVVPPNTVFSFPTLPRVTRAPGPFAFRFPFAVPFPFGGQGPLCWELRITSRRMLYEVVYLLDSAGAERPLATWSMGLGCNPFRSAIEPTVSANLSGTTLQVTVLSVPPQMPGLVVVGNNDQSFGGIPLPFLVPGSATGISGPCQVWSNIVLAQPIVGIASGGPVVASFPAVPASPQWAGLRVFTWALLFDPLANVTGLVTSDYQQCGWTDGLRVPIGQCSAYNDAHAVTGNTAVNGRAVVEFVF